MAKNKFDVIADAARPLLTNPSRANELAHAVVGALMSAGYEIVTRRTGPLKVGSGPPRRPLLTNAVAGEPQRRGVFTV